MKKFIIIVFITLIITVGSYLLLSKGSYNTVHGECYISYDENSADLREYIEYEFSGGIVYFKRDENNSLLKTGVANYIIVGENIKFRNYSLDRKYTLLDDEQFFRSQFLDRVTNDHEKPTILSVNFGSQIQEPTRWWK